VSELFETLDPADLVVQLGINCQMEIVIDLCDLSQILVLHLPAGNALLAGFIRVGEQNLVDYNVVNVDFLFSEFDGQSLGLVHR